MSFMDLVIAPPAERQPTIPPHPDIPARAILDAMLDPHLLLAPLRDSTGKIVDFTIIAIDKRRRRRRFIIIFKFNFIIW